MYRERDGFHCLQCGLVLVGKNRPTVAYPDVSHSGTVDNRGTLSTRQGVVV